MLRRLLFPALVLATLCGCSHESDHDERLSRFYPEVRKKERASLHEKLVAGTVKDMTFISHNSDVYDIVCNADRAIELVKNTEQGIWGEFPVLVGAAYIQMRQGDIPFITMECCDLTRNMRIVMLTVPVVDSQYRQLVIRIVFTEAEGYYDAMLHNPMVINVNRVPIESLLIRSNPSPDDPTTAIMEVSRKAGTRNIIEIPESEQLMMFVVNTAGFRSNGVRVMEVRENAEGGRYTRTPFGLDVLKKQ